jgi:hypothetical protein
MLCSAPRNSNGANNKCQLFLLIHEKKPGSQPQMTPHTVSLSSGRGKKK